MARPACPQIQRRLIVGCRGGDVLAVQRALYPALHKLDTKATNSKNGDFGPRTLADVRALQRALDLNPSGQVGTATLLALWTHFTNLFPAGAFDDYGVSLLFRVPLGHPTNIGARELRAGKSGPHVKALQRMLFRALMGDSRNSRNGEFGTKTQRDLALFLKRADWPKKSHTTVDQETWNALWPFGDDFAHKLAHKVTVTPADAIRARIRTWGEWYVLNRARITYSQTRPYPKSARLPIRTDCSGSSTHVLYMAGCPNDPHRRGYDGYGFTGTMYKNGTFHPIGTGRQLLPGDCVFYGNQGGGVPSHVVIVIGPGDRALDFGGNPPHFVWISSYWRSNLRTDIGARRYF